MNSTVRFFVWDKDHVGDYGYEKLIDAYHDAIIPQIGAMVFLNEESYTVDNIIYSYHHNDDIWVEVMMIKNEDI